MKSKIERFKRFFEPYIQWLPGFLVPLAERAGITSGCVMFTLVPGLAFGLMAFCCDVLAGVLETGKETGNGDTI